jgi:hypothetical protein
MDSFPADLGDIINPKSTAADLRVYVTKKVNEFKRKADSGYVEFRLPPTDASGKIVCELLGMFRIFEYMESSDDGWKKVDEQCKRWITKFRVFVGASPL